MAARVAAAVLGWGAPVAAWMASTATGAGAFFATAAGAAALSKFLGFLTNQANRSMNFSRAKATVEYVYAFMKKVLFEIVTVTDPRIKSGIVNFLAQIFSGKFSPTVMITLMTVACMNIVLRKNFSSGFSKLIIRLGNEILDALQNVGLHSGKGMYHILKKLAQLIEHMVSHYGRHILETIMYYVVGYGKYVKNPKTTTNVGVVIKDLQKAENNATAVLQNKANKVAAQTNSPKIKANSLPVLELRAQMAGMTAKHVKKMEALKAKTPGTNNARAMLKFQKMKNKREQEYKAHMEELQKKLNALKTPHGKVPSPPTAQQVAKINKAINTIANNSPSPNSNNNNNNNSPPKKKNTPAPSSAQKKSAINSLKRGYIKKQKRVHYAPGY